MVVRGYEWLPVGDAGGGLTPRNSTGSGLVGRSTGLACRSPHLSEVDVASLPSEAVSRRGRRPHNGALGLSAMRHDARVLLEISDVILWSVAGTTHHLGSVWDQCGINEGSVWDQRGISVGSVWDQFGDIFG